jgi:ABC-type branched-subunit amino acid transport system permease subunit
MVTWLVFNQPRVFRNGVVDVPPLDLPGIDLTQPRQKLIFMSVAFSLLGLGVVALRRSSLGRCMVAMKDSPLAAATMGMNLLATKLIAFAISAGIASFAGALDAGKVTPDQYAFERSLSIVLLTVVGGVSTVSGALFGGLLFASTAVLAQNIPSMKNVAKVLPGVIGISLGRNPDGASMQIADSFRPAGQHRLSIVIGVAAGVGLWALTDLDLINHWQFVVGLVVWTLAVVPNLPALLTGPVTGTPRTLAAVWLAVGVCLAAGVDWSSALPSTGSRILAIIVMVALFGPVAARFLDPAPRVVKESPDTIGIDRPFTDVELEQADRVVGAKL